jgi:hypothetical protein
MSSYVNIIERYHDYRGMIQEMLHSILLGLSDEHLFESPERTLETLDELTKHYPFIDIVYTLDKNGIQDSPNYWFQEGKTRTDFSNRGNDLSQRPYFVMAKAKQSVVFTDPYLSVTDRVLCLSGAIPITNSSGVVSGYLVIDLDLEKSVSFLMGDSLRSRFEPFFKSVYATIAFGLFCVVGILLYSGFSELLKMLEEPSHIESIRPFSSIIFITLGLAIFDLAKTTLEEEVLMHKDIFRHSSTRRTITRFMAAIMIAVSIEALLLMFKSAIGAGDYITSATWMMLSAVALMVGLGLYVYLGAKAESLLTSVKQHKLGHYHDADETVNAHQRSKP